MIIATIAVVFRARWSGSAAGTSRRWARFERARQPRDRSDKPARRASRPPKRSRSRDRENSVMYTCSISGLRAVRIVGDPVRSKPCRRRSRGPPVRSRTKRPPGDHRDQEATALAPRRGVGGRAAAACDMTVIESTPTVCRARRRPSRTSTPARCSSSARRRMSRARRPGRPGSALLAHEPRR